MGNEITHYILLVINYSWRLWIIYIFCLRHAVIYLFLIPIHLILSSLKSGLLAAQLAVLRSKAILHGAIPWFLPAELSLQQQSAADWTCRAVGLNENRPWVFRRSVSLHESTKTKQNKKSFQGTSLIPLCRELPSIKHMPSILRKYISLKEFTKVLALLLMLEQTQRRNGATAWSFTLAFTLLVLPILVTA